MVPPGYADEGDQGVECDERIEVFAMRLIDTGVQNLPRNQYHAIRMRYLRETGPSEWRSGLFPVEQVRLLANQAEEMLARFVAARGLQL